MHESLDSLLSFPDEIHNLTQWLFLQNKAILLANFILYENVLVRCDCHFEVHASDPRVCTASYPGAPLLL